MCMRRIISQVNCACLGVRSKARAYLRCPELKHDDFGASLRNGFSNGDGRISIDDQEVVDEWDYGADRHYDGDDFWEVVEKNAKSRLLDELCSVTKCPRV